LTLIPIVPPALPARTNHHTIIRNPACLGRLSCVVQSPSRAGCSRCLQNVANIARLHQQQEVLGGTSTLDRLAERNIESDGIVHFGSNDQSERAVFLPANALVSGQNPKLFGVGNFYSTRAEGSARFRSRRIDVTGTQVVPAVRFKRVGQRDRL
jgi:hypothetical protein